MRHRASATGGAPARPLRRWIGFTVIGLSPPVVFMALLPPLAQDPAYHDFADQRSWLGVPHFSPFVLVGALGVWQLAARQRNAQSAMPNGEHYAPLIVFAALMLTGLCSAWYHLQPDDQRLVWDRLPMTLVFMAVFSMLISERIGPVVGVRLLLPLCALGLFSVYWWASKDDLRIYALVQFYPIALMMFMLWRLAPRYTHGNYYWAVLAWYAAAKACELADAWLLNLVWFSGHSVKHLLAAAGAWWLLRMLQLRRAY